MDTHSHTQTHKERGGENVAVRIQKWCLVAHHVLHSHNFETQRRTSYTGSGPQHQLQMRMCFLYQHTHSSCVCEKVECSNCPSTCGENTVVVLSAEVFERLWFPDVSAAETLR